MKSLDFFALLLVKVLDNSVLVDGWIVRELSRMALWTCFSSYVVFPLSVAGGMPCTIVYEVV